MKCVDVLLHKYGDKRCLVVVFTALVRSARKCMLLNEDLKSIRCHYLLDNLIFDCEKMRSSNRYVWEDIQGKDTVNAIRALQSATEGDEGWQYEVLVKLDAQLSELCATDSGLKLLGNISQHSSMQLFFCLSV